MAKRSELTEIVLEMQKEVKGFIDEASKNPAPPFMEERMSKRDMRRRLESMSPVERAQFLQKHGLEQTLELIRSREPTFAPGDFNA